MTVAGYDVSAWQTTTPALAGVGFLHVRATYGTRPDPMYARHVAAARTAGLLEVGAYHFGTAATSGRVQASAFLAVAGAADTFTLDLETEHGRPAMSRAEAAAFIAAVKATGRRCFLYHSESGFPMLGQDGNWIANWSRIPALPWTFWQHHGGPLDRDTFNGTAVALRALAASAHPGRPVRLARVTFPAGTYRTARVKGSRFIGYGQPFTTGGFSAWSGPAVVLHNGSVKTTWFRLRTGPKAGSWCYRFDTRLAWQP